MSFASGYNTNTTAVWCSVSRLNSKRRRDAKTLYPQIDPFCLNKPWYPKIAKWRALEVHVAKTADCRLMSFALLCGMARRFFQFSTFPLRRPERNNLWGFGQIITQCLQTPVNGSVKWELKWYLMGSLWGSNDTFHAKRSAWEIGSIDFCCHGGSAQGPSPQTLVLHVCLWILPWLLTDDATFGKWLNFPAPLFP